MLPYVTDATDTTQVLVSYCEPGFIIPTLVQLYTLVVANVMSIFKIVVMNVMQGTYSTAQVSVLAHKHCIQCQYIMYF